MTCRFCKKPAVARFALAEGCFVYPGDREQTLCLDHYVTATPIGEMRLAEVLNADVWDWFVGTRT